MPDLKSRLDRLEASTPDHQRPVFVLDVPNGISDEERHQQTDHALQAAGYGDCNAIVIHPGITRGDVDRVQAHGPQWWQA